MGILLLTLFIVFEEKVILVVLLDLRALCILAHVIESFFLADLMGKVSSDYVIINSKFVEAFAIDFIYQLLCNSLD